MSTEIVPLIISEYYVLLVWQDTAVAVCETLLRCFRLGSLVKRSKFLLLSQPLRLTLLFLVPHNADSKLRQDSRSCEAESKLQAVLYF